MLSSFQHSSAFKELQLEESFTLSGGSIAGQFNTLSNSWGFLNEEKLCHFYPSFMGVDFLKGIGVCISSKNTN